MNIVGVKVIRRLISLIKIFNKDDDIKYLDVNDVITLEDFIKHNSEIILHTIDYINVYIELYSKLEKLNLSGGYVSFNNMYGANYLELLIDSYDKNNNNYIIKNILYNQCISIYNNLERGKKEIFLLNKVLNIYYKLFEIQDVNNYNKYMIELEKILDSDDVDDGGVSFGDLLDQFSFTLKNSYGIKKKNVKIKVLMR